MEIGATASDAGTAEKMLARLIESGEGTTVPRVGGLGMSAVLFLPKNKAQ